LSKIVFEHNNTPKINSLRYIHPGHQSGLARYDFFFFCLFWSDLN